jgi:hypothetical protein
MLDFKVIRTNNGESFLGIIKEETNESITVLFPMILTKQTIQLTPELMREVHTTTSFCPFTDDKEFIFQKRNLMFVKPMNDDAVPYYVDMLNKQETEESLLAYNLGQLIKPRKKDHKISEMAKELLEEIGYHEEELQEELPKNFNKKMLH